MALAQCDRPEAHMAHAWTGEAGNWCPGRDPEPGWPVPHTSEQRPDVATDAATDGALQRIAALDAVQGMDRGPWTEVERLQWYGGVLAQIGTSNQLAALTAAVHDLRESLEHELSAIRGALLGEDR